MRYKRKIKKHPRINDKKIVKKFAFLPVKLDNNIKCWLEYYHIEYVYEEVTRYIPEIASPYTYIDWVVISKY